MTTIRADKTIEFRFYRPSARQVLLAGDFSGWTNHAMNMASVGDGWWLAALNLPGGTYRFRYIADGNWYTDFASHGVQVCNEGWNSVLLVPENKDADETANEIVEEKQNDELNNVVAKPAA